MDAIARKAQVALNSDKGTYTQVPNFIFDSMGKMAEAELKVILCLTRLTCGYHRPSVECSLSAFQKASSLSRQGVINGITAGMERGVIKRTEGRRGGFVYELVNEVDQSTTQLVNEVDYPTSQQSGLVDASTSPRSRLELVNEVDRNTPVLKKGKEIGRLGRSLTTTGKRKKPTYPPTSQTPKLEPTQQIAFELLVDSEVGVIHRVADELARKLPPQDIYRTVDKWLPDAQVGKVTAGVLKHRLEALKPSNARMVSLSAGFRESELFHRHRLPDEMIADPERKQYNIDDGAAREPRKKYSV
jgi:hypothetical protein